MAEQKKNLDEKGILQAKKGSQKMNESIKKSFLKRGNSILQSQTSLLSLVKKHSTLNKICKLCDQPYPQIEMDSFGSCQHHFCHFCTLKYCIYNISINKVVACPQEGCDAELDQESQLFSKLPDKSQKRYQDFLLTNPQRHHAFKSCSTEKCKGRLDILQQTIKCNQCQTIFCKLCLFPLHNGVECSANFDSRFQNWKLCPTCNLPTEKNGSQNKALCPRKHSFCYICRQEWKPNHIDCQENLSPAQRFTKKFEKLPRLLSLVCLVLMIPIFPIYVGLILWFLIITFTISVIVVIGGMILHYFVNWKESYIYGVFLFSLLGSFYSLAAHIQAFKDKIQLYKDIIQGLWNAKQNEALEKKTQ